MWRQIAGVFVGLVTAMLLIMTSETISRKCYPYPPGTDPTDYHQLAAYMEQVPSGALLIVLAGWLIGGVACGFAIGAITRSTAKGPSIVAAVFLLSTGIVTLFLYPHPTWFRIISILLFVPPVLVGHWLANKITGIRLAK